jgi:hypothetical protein
MTDPQQVATTDAGVPGRTAASGGRALPCNCFVYKYLRYPESADAGGSSYW